MNANVAPLWKDVGYVHTPSFFLVFLLKPLMKFIQEKSARCVCFGVCYQRSYDIICAFKSHTQRIHT